MNDPKATPPQTELAHDLPADRREGTRWRFLAGVAFLVLLGAIFGRDLFLLGRHAAASKLHSHILLIPFVSAYLIYINRARLPKDLTSNCLLACLSGAAGVAVLIAEPSLRAARVVTPNDHFAFTALALILFLIAGGFFFLGARWMKAAAFPVGFLFFGIPLPDHLVEFLETASKYGSAEAASLFFSLSPTPVWRDGLVFQLPGIALEVAQECSGIRSSWVLLITSCLASYLFLNSRWRRALLVFIVIPLGLLRNGLRIVTIGLLCVYVSPDMIHSVVHRRGGPVFFALSLIPLFLLLWWLRRGDRNASRRA